MRATDLLVEALKVGAKTVLDVGVGTGAHAKAFIGSGAKVTGIDPTHSDMEHENYTHIHDAYENVDMDGEERFDLIWCSHTLEHIPNVQHFLYKLQGWLKPGGWLFIAVPSDRQARLHVGHLTLWTPAHLAYNLVCAGWDCKDVIWYTGYLSIGMVVQNNKIDTEWRTSMPAEVIELNQYMPITIQHNDGAWWGNNWPVEIPYERCSDPPLVTIGVTKTNLPPQTQLAYGPNPKLRVGYER